MVVENYGGIDVVINNAGVQFRSGRPLSFGEIAKTTMDINFYGALNVLKMMLPCVKSNGRIVNVSSVLCVPALKNCSKELQQEFESDKITEEDLCQLMNEFVTYAKSNTHEQRGFPTDAYGVSKIGVTVLTKMYGKIHFD